MTGGPVACMMTRGLHDDPTSPVSDIEMRNISDDLLTQLRSKILAASKLHIFTLGCDYPSAFCQYSIHHPLYNITYSTLRKGWQTRRRPESAPGLIFGLLGGGRGVKQGSLCIYCMYGIDIFSSQSAKLHCLTLP